MNQLRSSVLMALRRRRGQHRVDVQVLGLRAVVQVQLHAVTELLQFVEEGQPAGVAAAVVQHEAAAGGVQDVGHGQDRRDADAAGKQQRVLGIQRQREVVARPADLDLLAHPQLGMNRRRPAA